MEGLGQVQRVEREAGGLKGGGKVGRPSKPRASQRYKSLLIHGVAIKTPRKRFNYSNLKNSNRR